MSSDEGYSEEIDLRTISEDQLDKLIQKADKLGQKLEKARDAQEQISSKSAYQGAYEDAHTGGGIFGPDEGKFIGFKEAQRIGGGVKQFDKFSRSPAPFDPMLGYDPQEQEMRNEEIRMLKEEVERHEKEIIEQQKKWQEFLSKEREIGSSIQTGLGAFRNPVGMASGRLMTMLTGYGIPIALALTIVSQTETIVKEMFGPGGVYDVRKMVRDSVNEYMEVNVINAINRGDIYLGEGGQVITQRAPQISNTQRISYGHVRDILLNPGH